MNGTLRVIVIEDDHLLAETLVDSLTALEYQVLAQANSVAQALQSIETVACDFAIVDLYLKGETALPVLDKLCERHIPFLVATGAYVEDIPARYLTAPRLSKPYDMHELQHAIEALPLGALAQKLA
ncbi:MAG: response regulator [Rhodanobacter sp.]